VACAPMNRRSVAGQMLRYSGGPVPAQIRRHTSGVARCDRLGGRGAVRVCRRELGADPIELNGEDKSPYGRELRGADDGTATVSLQPCPRTQAQCRRALRGNQPRQGDLRCRRDGMVGTRRARRALDPARTADPQVPSQLLQRSAAGHTPTVYPRTTPMLWGRPRWIWRQAAQAELSYRLAARPRQSTALAETSRQGVCPLGGRQLAS